MKLWHVIQWGNKNEGGNGPDTQCVVSAPDMSAALEKANYHFLQYNLKIDGTVWKDNADVIRLLGKDDLPDGPHVLVIPVWISHAFNMNNVPTWHSNKGMWVDEKILFSDEEDLFSKD